MAETIVDGNGAGYVASVNSGNRLLVQTEGISATTGSASYNYVSSGTGWMSEPQFRDVIVSGIVPVSGYLSVDAGSQSWIQNFSDLGSNITGSVTIINTSLAISGGVHSEEQYKTTIAYSGAVQEYIGKAVPGANKSGASWQIQKLTYDGYNVTDIEFAGSSTVFDKVWNDRSTFAYR